MDVKHDILAFSFVYRISVPATATSTRKVQKPTSSFDRKPAAEKLWSEKLWISDLRTNKHFTLKENPLKRSDLYEFVTCYNPKNRHERKESERFKSFTYEELTKRDP